MKKTDMVPPSPALVIGLGGFAEDLLHQAQNLFLRSDPRRSVMVGFSQAVPKGEGRYEIKLRAIGSETGQEPVSLTSALHELRLHEKYLQFGIDDERDLPLGVIVLVDLVEEDSETLYPLLDALFDRMADEPGAFVHLLCKTAAFESDPARNHKGARLHLHLKKLEQVAQDAGLRLQIFLFDGLKEGSVEAKDEHEISVLMQNFLLALLSGGLARSLAHEYSLAAGDQGKTYYHSAGTTALVYDPSALQETCAVRLGAEALELEFLTGDLPDPKEIENTVEFIADGIGDESAWAETLCSNTLYRTKSDQSIGLDLHLSGIRFEGLPPHEWGDAIVGYAAHFEKNQQAHYLESLESNFASLRQAVVETLEKYLNALPARSALYPGGIAASLQVIQEMAKAIYRRIQSCLPMQNEEETAAVLDGDYLSFIDRLDDAISALPDPPRWMKRLPGRLYSHAKMLFEFLFFRREYAQLILLREEIIRALEDKFTFQFEQGLRKHLVDLCNQLIASLEKAQSDLKTLLSKFQGLEDGLEKRKILASGDASPFRVRLLSPALVDWVYALGKQTAAEIRSNLLRDGYLEEWRGLSEEYLCQKLLSACRDAFQFVNEFDAGEVLKRVEFAESAAALTSLALGAVPALRPDFDRGEESVSYLSNYLLCADPRGSDLADVLGSSAHTWQDVPTGDPCLILFCRVRQVISVTALSSLTQAARAAFEGLSEEEQSGLRKMFDGEKP